MKTPDRSVTLPKLKFRPCVFHVHVQFGKYALPPLKKNNFSF